MAVERQQVFSSAMNSPLRSDEIEDPVSVLIACSSWDRALADAATAIRHNTQTALDMLGLAELGVEVSFLLTGDTEMRALNKRWRDRDKPTNVLSFPALNLRAGERPQAEFDDQPLALGDVVLAYETVALEAASAGISFGNHFDHLVVHGVLHLLGYDHQSEAEAALMEGVERQVLNELGVPDPYEIRSKVVLALDGAREIRS